MPSLFILPSSLPAEVSGPIHKVGYDICQSMASLIGVDKVDGAQLINSTWRLQTKDFQSRTALLVNGLTIAGYTIQCLGKSPYLVDGKETIKLILGNVSLNAPDDDIKNALSSIGLKLGSEVYFEYYRDPLEKLTTFKSGRRFVYIAIPDNKLPRNLKFTSQGKTVKAILKLSKDNEKLYQVKPVVKDRNRNNQNVLPSTSNGPANNYGKNHTFSDHDDRQNHAQFSQHRNMVTDSHNNTPKNTDNHLSRTLPSHKSPGSVPNLRGIGRGNIQPSPSHSQSGNSDNRGGGNNTLSQSQHANSNPRSQNLSGTSGKSNLGRGRGKRKLGDSDSSGNNSHSPNTFPISKHFNGSCSSRIQPSPPSIGLGNGNSDPRKVCQNRVSPQSQVEGQDPNQFQDADEEQQVTNRESSSSKSKSPPESRPPVSSSSQPMPSRKGTAYDWFELGYVHSQTTKTHLTSSPINTHEGIRHQDFMPNEGEIDILELTIQQESIDFPNSEHALSSQVAKHFNANDKSNTDESVHKKAPVFNKTFTGQSDLSNPSIQNATVSIPAPKCQSQPETQPLSKAPSYMKKTGMNKDKKQATISDLLKLHRNNSYFYTHVKKNKKSTKNKVCKGMSQGSLQDTPVQTPSSTSSSVTPPKSKIKSLKSKKQAQSQKKTSELVNPYLKSKQRVNSKSKKDNKG